MQDKQSLRGKTKDGAELQPKGIHEWIDYYQKNKPQTNALAGGVMIILYGGQHIGWGIFNNHLQAQPWAGGYEDEGTVFWAIISWFIAAIVGFFVAAIIAAKSTKMSIYVFSGITAALSAALFILRPESVYYVFPARILAGFSHGIVYPTVLIHACEVAVPRMRGTVVATIHLCLFVGVFMTSSSLLPVYDTRKYEIDPTRTIGINGLVCIVSGLLIAIFFNRESPVFLIKKYKEQEAINVMIRLRSDSHETAETRRDFNELKMMVLEDNTSNVNIFERKNLWPLAVVLVMKIIFVASFNMPLNLIWLEAAEAELYNGTTDASGMVLSGARWLTLMVMMCLIDFKRIQFYRFSAGLSSSLLFATMFVIKSSGGVLEQTFLLTVIGTLFQVCSGLAIGILSDVYSTEAFNTLKKPFSIALTSSVEFLLQIFMIVSVYYLKLSFLTIIGLSALTTSLGFLIFLIPDTSMMNLRAARNKFNS